MPCLGTILLQLVPIIWDQKKDSLLYRGSYIQDTRVAFSPGLDVQEGVQCDDTISSGITRVYVIQYIIISMLNLCSGRMGGVCDDNTIFPPCWGIICVCHYVQPA